MANNIELITKFSPKYWDVVYKQESVTSVLDANPKMINFTGTKTVKIGKWSNGGLQDYYRNNVGDDRVPVAGEGADFAGAAGFGYQKSSARLEWEEFTLKMDRAAAFEIEYFDNEESGEEIVGLGVTEISRTAMVPEVDAYCLSTIAGYTATELGNRVSTAITADNVVAEINKALLYFDEHEVPAEDQIIFASPVVMNALRNTDKAGLVKPLMQGDFKDVKFSWEKYEGRDIIMVAPNRFKMGFKKLATGGYGFTGNNIQFLAVSKSAVMHVVKYEKVKVIGGDANLAGRGFDGYTVFARIYHDVFVPDNKRIAIYASIAGDATPAIKLSVLTSKGKVASIATFPGDKLYTAYTSSAAESVGQTATGTLTAIRSGDRMEANTKCYLVDTDKKVLATCDAVEIPPIAE